MEDAMFAGLLAVFGILALTLFYIVGSSVLNGWVLSKLWLWFMVPMFGFKPISVVYAIGLALTVRFLTVDYSFTKQEKQDTATILLIPVFGSLFALAFGWLVHLFV
jgi:hypothetical protein